MPSPGKKAFPLRLDPALHAAIERLAAIDAGGALSGRIAALRQIAAQSAAGAEA